MLIMHGGGGGGVAGEVSGQALGLRRAQSHLAMQHQAALVRPYDTRQLLQPTSGVILVRLPDRLPLRRCGRRPVPRPPDEVRADGAVVVHVLHRSLRAHNNCN